MPEEFNEIINKIENKNKEINKLLIEKIEIIEKLLEDYKEKIEFLDNIIKSQTAINIFVLISIILVVIFK